MNKPVWNIVRDAVTKLRELDQEPEDGFATGAWELAELVCMAQLVRTDGSVEKGMKRIGQRSFDKWANDTEGVIEQENPG